MRRPFTSAAARSTIRAAAGFRLADLVVEAQDDDTRRRRRDHLGEELVLLGQPDALVAQPVDHAVVERDHRVHVGSPTGRNRDVNASSWTSRDASAARAW